MTGKRKYLWLLIIASAALRCIFAAVTELSNDEALYRILSLYPATGYYAHPPMVAWLCWLTTGGGPISSELLVRLSSVIIGTINTWLIYKVALRLSSSERTGLIAALLYTGSVYASVFIGITLLPDGMLSLCWILSLDIMLILARNKNLRGTYRGNSLMLSLGLIIGIAALSKYTAGYLWVAWLIYILLYDRKWLTSWSQWLGIFLSAAIFTPVIIWNIQNGFASINNQTSRLLNFNEILWWSPFREFAGNFGYQNPINWTVFLLSIIFFIHHRERIEKSVFRLLIIASVPMILMFFFASFTQPTLPHWCAPAYFSLILLAALYLGEKENGHKVAVWSASVLAVLLILAGIEIVAEPVAIPRDINAKDIGRDDITLDMYGWKQGGEKFKDIYEYDLKHGAIRHDAAIIHDIWYEGAHLEHYFAMPLGLKQLTYDNMDYEAISRRRGGIKPGSDAYFISSSRTYVEPYENYGDKFTWIEDPEIIEIMRGDKLVEKFYVYRLHGAIPAK